MDGKLLKRAKDRLDGIRKENERETARRREEIHARLPRVAQIDTQLRSLMTGVIGAALLPPRESEAELARIEQEGLALSADRAERLVAAGYPAEYLEELHSCPRCRDTGYVRGEMCTCLKTLYEQERAKEMSSLLKLGDECFSGFALHYYDARPNPATGVSDRQIMQAVLNACRRYAETFGAASVNLLFQGAPGLGKTYLSACVARAVSQKGYAVVYETIVAALEAFETQKFSRNPDEAEQAGARVRRLLESDLLVLDDLGTEMVTSFTLSALYTLLNTRLLRGRKTVISTNFTMEELRRLYTPQIMSRLEGEYQLLQFVGEDIRAQKKARGL
jgi:DNA replication protein DnaC